MIEGSPGGEASRENTTLVGISLGLVSGALLVDDARRAQRTQTA